MIITRKITVQSKHDYVPSYITSSGSHANTYQSHGAVASVPSKVVLLRWRITVVPYPSCGLMSIRHVLMRKVNKSTPIRDRRCPGCTAWKRIYVWTLIGNPTTRRPAGIHLQRREWVTLNRIFELDTGKPDKCYAIGISDLHQNVWLREYDIRTIEHIVK